MNLSDKNIYELHCHTSIGSKCGQATGAEMAEMYHKFGYTGIVITEHFFNGNSTVPKKLPWNERVDLFMKGYEDAKEYGDKVGLDVFFGFEISNTGADWLIYGLGKEWLYAHPYCDEISTHNFLSLARQDGGVVVHAHPFREMSCIRLIPRETDCVEILNAGRTDSENHRADAYAKLYGFPAFCGSDCHKLTQLKFSGMEAPYRVESALELAKLAKERKVKLHHFERQDENEFSLAEIPFFGEYEEQ